MKVLIPSALHSYTGQARIEASGGTLAEVLATLEERYPGMRFRMIDERGCIRPHVRFFHDGAMVHDLAKPLRADGELNIVLALSGG